MYVFNTVNTAEWVQWAEAPDSPGYLALAEDLKDLRLDEPSYRTPGYTYVIALLSNIGVGDLHLKVLIFQQIIDGIIAYIIFLLLVRLKTKFAIIPSILYLLHPYSLSYSSLILPATFASIFVIIASYFILKKGIISAAQALYIGLILSLGIMVRPMLIYSAVMLSIYLFMVNWRQYKKVIIPVLLLLFASSIFPFILTQYNKSHFNMNSISSQGNFEMAARIAVITGSQPQANMFIEGGFKDSIENLATTDGLIDYELRDSIYSDITIQLFKQNPLPVVKAHLLGWIGFLRLGNPQLRYIRFIENEIGSPFNRSLQLYVFCCSVIMYPGMLLGLFQRRNKEVKNFSILALMWFAYISVVHAALCGPYYFIPIMGLVLTAGYAGWIEYFNGKLKEPNS